MNTPWLVAVAVSAAAPGTGNVHVDAFVADVTAGRREAALARVYEMNSLTGDSNAVATAEEFVEMLLRCRYLSSETRDVGQPMYDLRWRCADGDYYSLLDPHWNPPRLVVGEFLSAARREQRAREVPSAPPPLPTKSVNDD